MRPETHMIECMLDFGRLPLDLKEVAQQLRNEGTRWEAYCIVFYGEDGVKPEAEAGAVLWVPETGRAGVTWGGDAWWTDADNPDDAVERYLSGDESGC